MTAALPGAAVIFLYAATACAAASHPATPAAVDPAADRYHDVAAAYLVRAGDRTLWSASADRPLPPASLTKIMTALVVLEDYRPDDVAETSAHAAGATGKRIGLARGDRLRVADLLAATVVASANDACRALAEWRAGSESRFVELMNERARSFGLQHTHFANACGFDAPGHYASAADLARLAERALAQPVFAALAAKVRMAIATVDGRRRFDFENANELIGRYAGAIGVKSGYTARAGTCVIAAVERHGVRVVLVLLNARNRWWDAQRILDDTFDYLATR